MNLSNTEDVKWVPTYTERTFVKNVLREKVVSVTFTKKDGTERVMNCTLQEDLIPAKVVSESANTANVVVRTVNDDVVPVYDIDAKGWRSFRWDSVKSIEWSLVEGEA